MKFKHRGFIPRKGRIIKVEGNVKIFDTGEVFGIVTEVEKDELIIGKG